MKALTDFRKARAGVFTAASLAFCAAILIGAGFGWWAKGQTFVHRDATAYSEPTSDALRQRTFSFVRKLTEFHAAYQLASLRAGSNDPSDAADAVFDKI